jgi:hypothetical protein
MLPKTDIWSFNPERMQDHLRINIIDLVDYSIELVYDLGDVQTAVYLMPNNHTMATRKLKVLDTRHHYSTSEEQIVEFVLALIFGKTLPRTVTTSQNEQYMSDCKNGQKN